MGKAKQNFRLTLKTARALIKQEFGVHGDLTVERAEGGVYIYKMQHGRFEITVSNDWFEKNGLIDMRIAHESAGSIQMFFDPDTLEEDYDAEVKHRREIQKEQCDGCSFEKGQRRSTREYER